MRSSTWYLIQMRLRTWDHSPEITRLKNASSKVRGVSKVWTPVPEAEKAKFQELVLCPRGDHDEAPTGRAGEEDGMAFAHDRLVAAVAEIKVTTTSPRNRNKFCVPEESRRNQEDGIGRSQVPEPCEEKTTAHDRP